MTDPTGNRNRPSMTKKMHDTVEDCATTFANDLVCATKAVIKDSDRFCGFASVIGSGGEAHVFVSVKGEDEAIELDMAICNMDYAIIEIAGKLSVPQHVILNALAKHWLARGGK